MANELVHGTVGVGMTQAEFEAVGLHVINSQATGDVIYASSATQLSRLGIGATNAVLTVIGGVPTWQTTLSGLTFVAPALGAATGTSLQLSGLTASEILSTDGSKNLVSLAVATYPSLTELSYVKGVTSAIQTQMNLKAPLASPSFTGTVTLPSVTLSGTVTLAGQIFSNAVAHAEFDNTGAGYGLIIKSTQGGTSGGLLQIYHNSDTPAAEDIIAQWHGSGNDSVGNQETYVNMRFVIADPTSASEDGRIDIYMLNAGAANLALQLTGAGTLSVDLSGVSGTYANVDLFDDYDDALILRQTIQERNREMGVKLGLFYEKDTGSGYMMNVQPMIKLLSGAAYQAKARIDELERGIVARLEALETRNKLLPQGGS